MQRDKHRGPRPGRTGLRARRRRTLLYTVIAAVMVSALLSMPHAGIFASVLILVLGITLPIDVYRIVARPELRGTKLIQLGIWAGALAVIFTVQATRHFATRRDANRIVASLEAFRAAHGHYPSSLDEIGISHQALGSRLGPAGYILTRDRPYFFYAVTYAPFDAWDYDFNRHMWVHEYD